MNNQPNYKNILLAALGTTPQIITESLYHLMVTQKIPIQEIHLITTTQGKDTAEKNLFKNGAGPFYRFCREYGFSAIEINTHYHVIENAQGEKLSDIRTPADNQAAADFFLKIVRELTSRSETRIFATIAGGRKTMSAYLYFTMQLLGRDQDTLYHVLVHPESIESNPAFYFPRKDVEEMEFLDKNKNPFSVPVKDIRIDMAEIPFVKLRRILQKGILESVTRFSDLVASAQAELGKAQFEPELIVDLPGKLLQVKDRENTKPIEIKLRPVEITFYAYLCHVGKFVNSNTEAEKVAPILAKIHRTEFATVHVSKYSFHYKALQSIRARVNNKIQKAIPNPHLAQFVQIHSDKDYYKPSYSIALSKNKITIRSTDSSLFN
ncbi:MAG: TIGR02584 family CRISPR-associated protein [Calditrichaeota bacterium]|nr:MAG: TIGR02584 family CRISPR-associated protein [Calditrichota bacterium]